MSDDSAKLRVKHDVDRKKHTDAVLNSTARKRIIAAGPGTGKTFLFGEICKKAGNNNLILSFINELVNDIRAELGEVADVRTLHSFARKFLKADFYMKLTEVIEEDFKLYNDREVPFKEIFSRLSPGFEEELKFYSTRRKYYKHFGPFCAIYTLIKVFEEDAGKIPEHSQILVDEFQDFNKLETRLIDLLSDKSPILVAGDDDQSLYTFKFAEPNEIRARFKSEDYESFELPYCSRCTEVLVGATNKLIEAAQAKGFLDGRINKAYKYFSSDSKDAISAKHPKILLQGPVYRTQLAAYLDSAIRDISQKDDDSSVLIICTLTNQIQPLADALRKKGFTNVEVPPERTDLTKREAYSMLLEDDNSNLAWRILSNHMFNAEELKELVKSSVDKQKPFPELFVIDKKKHVIAILRILRKIKDKKDVTDKEADLVFNELGYNPKETTIEKIKEEVLSGQVMSGGYKATPIKIVTMLGAKGLTRDYVFLVNCDDRFVLDHSIATNENICKFLVALTRAKKKLTIFTGQNSVPTFLQWIGTDFYQKS